MRLGSKILALFLVGAVVFFGSYKLLAAQEPTSETTESRASNPKDRGKDSAKSTTETDEFSVWFGSYGRVQMSSDLEGGRGKDLDVVAHGARLEESPYLELYMYSRLNTSNARFDAVVTLAFFDLEEMFHYSGEPRLKLALRNMYVEASEILGSGAFFWVGSRMYRGDDIYLLDYWPLDNHNTIGGGGGWRNRNIEAAFHVGVNRLSTDYQFQEITVPGRGYGVETVTVLDRQRTIGTFKFEHRFPNLWRGIGFKYKLYTEFQYIPSGERHRPDMSTESLPSDWGYAIGAQLGCWGFSRNGFLNLFFKLSRGLSAYNELEVPYGVALDKTTQGAEELLFGISGNYEYKFFGVLIGGYLRRWLDAMPHEYDLYDRAEAILVARPMVFFLRYFRAGFEISWQRRESPGEEDVIGTTSVPQVFKFSPILAFAPHEGSLARPEFRLFYTLAVLNEGARFLYPLGDKRREMKYQHFLGFGVEWWFNWL